jgi:hypothetical protein
MICCFHKALVINLSAKGQATGRRMPAGENFFVLKKKQNKNLDIK